MRREAITQIKYTARGKWSWKYGGQSKKKRKGRRDKEGETQMEEAGKYNNVRLM